MNTSTQKGFTLIELLVVVAIIGVLAAVGAVAFSGFMKNSKRTVADRQCHQVIKEIRTLWQGCDAGIPLYLRNDWGDLDTNSDWCTHTQNNFTMVQEWESHFRDIYLNPYFANETGDVRQALRESCSRPDDMKPGCIQIQVSNSYQSAVQGSDPYWYFTCYNLDQNDNLITYEDKILGIVH